MREEEVTLRTDLNAACGTPRRDLPVVQRLGAPRSVLPLVQTDLGVARDHPARHQRNGVHSAAPAWLRVIRVEHPVRALRPVHERASLRADEHRGLRSRSRDLHRAQIAEILRRQHRSRLCVREGGIAVDAVDAEPHRQPNPIDRGKGGVPIRCTPPPDL